MSGSQFWKRAGLVIVAATVVNIAVFLVAKAVGVEILVPQGGAPTALSVAPVMIFTIIPLVLATVLLLLLRRLGVSRPGVFAGIVVVGTVLSLLAPLTADLTVSNKVALAVMHVVAGGAALIGLTPLLRPAQVDAPSGAVSNA